MPIDLRLAVRFLRRRWLSSLAVAGTLAVGLAITAGLFVIADGVLLREYPVRQPEQLFVVGPRSVVVPNRPGTIASDQFEQLSELSGVRSAAAYTEGGFFERRFSEAEALRPTAVTARFFQTLGVAAQAGRTLAKTDALAVDPYPVVISDALWGARFGRSRDVVGKTLLLGGRSVQVVGVAPRGFDLPRGTNVWVPDTPHPAAGLHMEYLQAIVRVDRTAPLFLPGPPAVSLLASPLRQYFRPSGTGGVVALFIATALTLLIGWVHLAALQTAQAGDSWRSLTLRAALGAGQRRLALCWLFQTSLLSAGAALIALVVLEPAVRIFARLLPPEVTRGQPIVVDHRAVLYLGALTVAGSACLAAGPLLLLRRHDLMAGLRGRLPVVGGLSYSGLRSAMLVAQVALVGGLLYLAAVTVHALADAKALDIGIDTEQVVGVALPTDVRRFGPSDFELMRRGLGQMPFVVDVARGDVPVGVGKAVVSVLAHAPRNLDEMRDCNGVELEVSRGYFRTVGCRILSGSDEELATQRNVVLLSLRLSQMLGIDRSSAVGTSVYVNGVRASVIGIVSNIWGDGPGAAGPTPYIYRPDRENLSSVVVRTPHSAGSKIRAIVDVIRRTTGVKGPLQVTLARERYSETTAQVRSQATLLTLLSLSSFCLGTFGVFCLTSESVRRGARDAAVRATLGASPQVLVVGVVMTTVRRVAVGGAVGLGFGVATAKLAAALVTGVRPIDWMAALSVMGILTAAGAISSFIPARAAGRADVLMLLREE